MTEQQQAVTATDPFIGTLIDQLDAAMLDYHSLCDPLTQQQIEWRPDANRWSVAQCLQHTTLTLQLYFPEIERMMGEARQRAASGASPFREYFIARRIIASQEPPPRMRVRTKRSVDPPATLQRDAVMSAYETAHRRFRELLLACDGVPLGHAHMRSPFMRLFRFTLAQSLQINVVHTRRHLWQARQVTQEPAFPR